MGKYPLSHIAVGSAKCTICMESNLVMSQYSNAFTSKKLVYRLTLTMCKVKYILVSVSAY